ncbi:MAG TPA: hypothetical protein VLB74_07090 [Flavobacterium sp.]|uniref:hypothetical protein n=1 Tax=Flavobacterium sp. TaxID=239 RepID=UPI002BD6C38D|nr:hypothetical protein [Flavobacterium sp.]HSD14397.1 hypothetical protein [Flavobacterium sp.]
MTKNSIYIVLITSVFSCAPKAEIVKYGKHYQKHNDYKSLVKAVELMPKTITTSEVKKILGEPPIDNGFDYRYLVDSTGVNNCTIGAVFTIDSKGKITNRWVDEICE